MSTQRETVSVRNTFDTMGDKGVLQSVIGDLSFPRVPGMQMMRRGGPVCSTCMLLPEDHQTPAAQAGYSPLTGVPGVHPSVDDGSAHNAADDLYADPRPGEFGVGRSAR